MKKSFVLITIFLIAASIAAAYVSTAASDAAPSGVYLQISLASQDPDPAEPGKTFTARFKIENPSGDAAKNVEIELLPEYPFSLYTGDAVQNIGQIVGADEYATIIDYVLKVDAKAVEGTAALKLRYKFDGSSSWVTKEFDISIRTHDAMLLAEEIRTPANVAPGATANVQVVMRNYADSPLKNIKAKLDLSSSELPFGFIDSIGEKSLYQIASGDSATINFEIKAQSDADSKLYRIPLAINYMDSLGNSYNKSGYVSLTVGDAPDLSLFLTEGTLYEKTPGKITLQIVNKGLANVKFVTVKLNPSGEYDLVSPDEVYLGVIDSDDFETVDFTIYPKSEQAKLSLTLDFSDSNNNKFTKEYSKTLKVYSSSEAKRLGLKSASSTGIILFVIVILAGVFIYRRYRKKKAR
jgi:hypothetical protein